MKARRVGEKAYTITMKVGFLDLVFMVDGKDQFVTIKNHGTQENLTRIFNKEGMYTSFPIKDDEIGSLVKLCSKFTNYCTKSVMVSMDTTYENMDNI